VLVLALGSMLLADPETTNTAGSAQRVPFPKNYATAFQEVRASNQTADKKLGTIYANAAAASIDALAKLPYPNGSVIVMEWAEPLKGANGEFLQDASGNWKKGDVVRIDVMRRENGFGAGYGEKRAGEWEFASYRPDGTLMATPQSSASCAACHAKVPERDFVFRGRFPAIEKK
jgi:hypothetical protein